MDGFNKWFKRFRYDTEINRMRFELEQAWQAAAEHLKGQSTTYHIGEVDCPYCNKRFRVK